MWKGICICNILDCECDLSVLGVVNQQINAGMVFMWQVSRSDVEEVPMRKKGESRANTRSELYRRAAPHHLRRFPVPSFRAPPP